MNRRLRPPATLALVALIGVIGAGCSNGPAGSDDTGSAGGGAGPEATEREQGVKFAECMRENGVGDFPDPNASGDFVYGISVSGAVWQKAVGACKDLQPPGSLSADRDAEQQTAALTFARCMRANGVKDFPDPVDGEPLIDTNRIPSSEVRGGMSILNAAIAKCRDPLSEAAGGGR